MGVSIKHKKTHNRSPRHFLWDRRVMQHRAVTKIKNTLPQHFYSFKKWERGPCMDFNVMMFDHTMDLIISLHTATHQRKYGYRPSKSSCSKYASQTSQPNHYSYTNYHVHHQILNSDCNDLLWLESVLLYLERNVSCCVRQYLKRRLIVMRRCGGRTPDVRCTIS